MMSLRSWFPLGTPLYRPCRRLPVRRDRYCRLGVEVLEERTLLSASPANTLGLADLNLLSFTNNQLSETGYLATAQDVRLYRIDATTGDMVTVAVHAQSIGSGLNSYVRIFGTDGAGGPVHEIAANDDFEGTDSRLTFQAANGGPYYVGVSASGNDAYKPANPPDLAKSSILLGATHGAYQLDLTLQRAAPAQPGVVDLVASLCTVQQDAAAPGDTLDVAYRIENRGGAASPDFSVQFVLSASNRFTSTTLLGSPIALSAADDLDQPLNAQVTLPDTLTAGTYYVGIEILPANGSLPGGLAFNENATRGAGWDIVNVLDPYAAGASSFITDATTVSGSAADSYTVTVDKSGQLTARVENLSGQSVLTLMTQGGIPLIQSADSADFIQQHVGPGTYILKVAPLNGSSVNYRLSSVFTPAADPLANIPLGADPSAMVTGDFNGDGIADLAVAEGSSLVILPGLGDGSFGASLTSSPTGQTVTALYAADFNNDGIADLVAVDSTGTVSIDKGLGDGQFATMPDSLAITDASAPMIAVADFNYDGITDLAIGTPSTGAPSIGGSLNVYLGVGDGTFTTVAGPTLNDFAGPLAVGDFNRDGWLDITAGSGTVLQGKGDGTFMQQIPGTPITPVTVLPKTILVADLNGDGRLDLVALPSSFTGSGGHALNGSLTISYGIDDFTFQTRTVGVVGFPTQVGLADLNGDNHWDIIFDNGTAVGALLGTGLDGPRAFAAPTSFGIPLTNRAESSLLATGDFNGDGRIDLVAGLVGPGGIAVLAGGGDGTVAHADTQPQLPAGTIALASGAFTDSGYDDLAAANLNGNNVTVSLSDGNGLFATPTSYSFFGPSQVVTGDFNGDGRLDLAAFCYLDLPFMPAFDPKTGLTSGIVGIVGIYLGLGDGTFQATTTVDVFEPVPGEPPMFAADFNHDGNADLVIGHAVYLANVSGGSLNFTQQQFFLSGNVSAVGQFTGDANPDVVVGSNGESILPGNGDGTFGAAVSSIASSGTVKVGDFDGNGVSDLAVLASGQITTFLGDGAGNFTASGVPLPIDSAYGQFVTVGDFNHDGKDDLAVAYQLTNGTLAGGVGGDHVTIYESAGDGSFTEEAATYAISPAPTAIVTGDFNGDGNRDLAAVSSIGLFTQGQITVLLGQGDGTFINPTEDAQPTSQALPQLGDINGDGTPDVVVVDANGDILYRQGIKGQAGQFGAPVLVNAGNPARDFTIVTDTVPRIAAVDYTGNSISIYTPDGTGGFSWSKGPSTSGLLTRIVGGDLDGDHKDDLVVINSNSGTLTIFLSSGPTQDLAVAGNGPFSLALAKMDPAATVPDIVVTNAISGDVSVFCNSGNGTFGSDLRFRAGAGPFDLARSSAVGSGAGTAGFVVGFFTNGSQPDVVALNRSANTFSLLTGPGGGVLADARTFQAGSLPTVVAAGDFDKDGNLDLAILDEGDDTIAIYRGDGLGNFHQTLIVSGGNDPTGLTVADVNKDGKLDLVVGNAFGDVLMLLGQGGGAFAPYERVDQVVSLAVFHPNGQTAVFLGNQGQDRLSVQNAQGANTPLLSRTDSLLSPNVVQADVNLDGVPDLIVLNGGGNSVRVCLANPDGTIDTTSAQSFFVGTNPSSVAVADVNGDGIPDLVITNEGSNDVSLLFGTAVGINADKSINGWSAKLGPRLKAGTGPDSVAVADVYDNAGGKAGQDGIADLIISNQQANNLWIVPGVGNGFFKDSAPIITSGLSGKVLASGDGAFVINPLTGIVAFIPDLRHPGVHFTVPGMHGSDGVSGDFNNDGITDALVVNGSTVDLILGETNGFSIAASLDTQLSDASSVAVASEANGLFSFYVSYVNAQNIEAAQQFAIDLQDTLANPDAALQLASVEDSSLALIAVLVSASNVNPDSAEGSSSGGGAAGASSFPRALFDIDSSYDPSAEKPAGAFGDMEPHLRQGLNAIGDHLLDDARLLSKLWPDALDEIGSSVTGRGTADGLEGPRWLAVMGRSLAGLRQVGHDATHAVGKAFLQLEQSATRVLPRSADLAVPPMSQAVPATDSDQQPRRVALPSGGLSLDAVSAALVLAEPARAEPISEASGSHRFGWLASALLALGLTTSTWRAQRARWTEPRRQK